MRITKKAIIAIKGNTRLKNRLALDMERHWSTIDRWIDMNEPNGAMTTYKAVQLIKEETGLSESDILCEEVKEEVQR